MFLLFSLFVMKLSAQTIFSNGTGGGIWSSPTTWLGGVVPNVNSDVVISGGDSVTTTTGAVCKNLTIYSDGKLATGVDSVYVVQTLTLEADAYFYNLMSKPTLPGSIRDLDPQSYVVHSGSGTVGGPGNLEFGNLVIKRSAGTVPGGNLLIHGDLIINNTAGNVVFRGVRPASGSLTHTIEGNVYILQGILSCIDVGDNNLVGIFNIHGNVYVIDAAEPYQESRIGPFSSANAAGLGIFNIGGDLIVLGGRVQGGTSSSAGPGNGIFNLAGNFILDGNSNVATNTLGWVAFNFVGNGEQYVSLGNKFQMNTAIYDTIAATAQVVFDLDTNKWGTSTTTPTGGDFVVNGSLELIDSSFIDGPGSFTLSPGATLKIGSPDGISITGSTGNIRVSGGRIFSEEANYEYKSSIAQQLGTGLPAAVNGLIINNQEWVVLDHNLTVNETLHTLLGDLDLSGNTISLGGNAMLIETQGNTVTGSAGKIKITKNVTSPSGLNVGGLGVSISSSANLGNTTIERTHFPAAGQGNQGIERVFNIVPENNSELNATVRFYYDETELNGISENNLIVFKSPDGTNNSWFSMGGIVNSAENYVEVSGLNDFSFWTLADINAPLPVKDEENTNPSSFSLSQNYPNPFNPSTTIRYSVARREHVDLKIYDVIGNEVITLVNEVKEPGVYSLEFDVRKDNQHNLSSGIYFFQMRTESFVQTNKMILLK